MSKSTKNRRLHSVTVGILATLELLLEPAQAKSITEVEASQEPASLNVTDVQRLSSTWQLAKALASDTENTTAVSSSSQATLLALISTAEAEESKTATTLLSLLAAAEAKEAETATRLLALISAAEEENSETAERLLALISTAQSENSETSAMLLALISATQSKETETPAMLLALISAAQEEESETSSRLLALISAAQEEESETSANLLALITAAQEKSSETSAMLLALLSLAQEEESETSSRLLTLIAAAQEEESETSSRLLALIAAAQEEESETSSTLLALIAAAQEEASETAAALLALLSTAEAEESETSEMLLALIAAAQEEESETSATLLTLISAVQEEAEESETAAMLLALISEAQEAGSSTSETLLALISAAQEEDGKTAETLLALLEETEENTQARQEKTPWLARLPRRPEADEQPQGNVNEALLSLNLQATEEAKKQPSPWISLTPIELIPSNDAEVAILNDSVIRRDTAVYDVSDLQQVAITPAELADENEVAVSVRASEVDFLSPQAGDFLDVPATTVVLRFPIGGNIALLVNGKLVDSGLVGRTETDSETQLRTQSWYGVPLVSGENILEVVSTDTGDVLQRLPLTVRGQPEELVLLSSRPIPSDGRSTANIRGQLVDSIGNISRWDSVATLQTSDGKFIGADYDPDMPGFQVEIQRGEFVAQLQSSLESKLVQIQAIANGFEAFGQVQFETPQRPSLLSGVVDLRLGARGTDYYDSFREFLPTDGDNSYQFDVDAAIFATGNLGEWLYTGAYNSDRTLNENCRGESTLFRTSSGACDNVYATYGDDSYSDVVAPSLDSVYLRLERNSPSNDAGIDYAMWGDFNTEEFASASQLFTATSRQLHGFKTNYNFGNLALTGLYANNVEGFQRDTIAPDGTSGFYFTSQRDVVPGSESVYLELEELERPGTVLERQQLSRGIDYEIDYDRGTLLFNEPVMRTAIDDFGQLLVRRIVTTYQHENGNDTNILAGRLQYSLNRKQGQESWVGASYFDQNQGSRDFTLYGADAQIALGENAKIIAELAKSSSNFDTTGEVNGTAYRLELDGDLGNWLDGRAYVRSTDAGFTNSATTSFVPGQTRYGAQLSGRIGSTTSLRARFDHEDNFGTAPRVVTDLSELLTGETSATGRALDNSLTTYSLGVSQRLGRGHAEIDWIHRDRTDRLNSDSNLSTDQLRTRFTTPISDKLSVVAQNELNLSSNSDPIYPSRTLLGLNWEAMPGLNVGVNQIFYGGGGNSRGSYTSIDVTGEHTFASDTTVRGRFSTIDGRQIGGTIGLEQGINLAPGLDLDLGYEKVFSTFGNSTAASTQFSQPVARSVNGASALGLSGGESYNVGLSYTDNADFQASTRFEHRSSTRSSNTTFNISALGRISPSLTLLGDYRLARTANQNITGLGTTSLLKLGMAYRDPDNDRFNALLRYEHRMNPNSVPTATFGSSTEIQEHLFSAEAIYAPNWRWELYGKYALRNSRTDITTAGNSFSGSSTVQLAQARATYRLGYRWDVMGEARWLAGSGYDELGVAIEAGYYPLPDLRILAGYSGGATDTDFGENRDAGGFYIGATAKLGGLLDGFGTQPNDPAQQQESALEVSQESLEPVVESVLSEFNNNLKSSSVSDSISSDDDEP